MNKIEELKELFVDFLSDFNYPTTPKLLYEPISYIMNLGGKRIRPVLLLAANNLYSEDVSSAMNAAYAFEVFHNFSLLHDDIMDDAILRRGNETVHVRYNENVAILSGDLMLIYSYKILEVYKEKLDRILSLFTKTAIEVCEGQRMDMDFEETNEVSISNYLKMIELKTSVLIAAALKTGGILGGATDADANHLYEFGKNLGIAFQIQDDILDTFGTEELLGKQIGGDIKQKKKTYLYLKALQLLDIEKVTQLKSLFDQDSIMTDEKIKLAKELLIKSHVKVHAEELKLVYQQLALSHLNAIDVENSKKMPLRELSEYLLNRNV